MKDRIVDIISFMAMLLFPFNDFIANYFYPQDTDYDKYIDFRFNEYAIIIFLSLIIHAFAKSRASKFFLCILIGMSAQDVFDRAILGITEFQTIDLVILVGIIAVSYVLSYDRVR